MTELVTLSRLKGQLDDIDKRVVTEVYAGFYESRLKIEMSAWQKGKIVSEFREVNSEATYAELKRLTGRNDKSLKAWCELYERYPDFDRFLTEYAKPRAEAWTKKALRDPGRPALDSVETPPLPAGKFRTLVLDPPWPVEKIERVVRPNQEAALDYPTMSLEEIAALPIGSKTADGCHVYLWVTHKFLPTGLDLFEKWGVNYECTMTWVKPTGMTPYSWMYNTEHVLFGRVGNLPLERKGLKLSFEAPVVRHSEKPDIFYELVRQASPGPRLEMFARKVDDGFEAWGNEIPLEVPA